MKRSGLLPMAGAPAVTESFSVITVAWAEFHQVSIHFGSGRGAMGIDHVISRLRFNDIDVPVSSRVKVPDRASIRRYCGAVRLPGPG